MTHKTLLVGVGTSGHKALDNCSKKVIPADLCYGGLKTFSESEDEIRLLAHEILQAALNYETVVLLGGLGSRSQSLILLLSDAFLQSEKEYFVLVTLPMCMEGNAKRREAEKTVQILISNIPKLRFKFFDIETLTKTIIDVELSFGIEMADLFFEDEIAYILKYGSLYRIFNLE